MNYWGAFGIGCLAGICSGLFGVGGGIIIIPMLVFLLGYSQVEANGTSLVALLLPVGFLGVWEYYQSGKISVQNLKVGLCIAAGIFSATVLGAKLAILLPDFILKRIFSVFLVLVALKFWL